MINIRIESQEDIHQVHPLNEQAFEQPAEANIVDKLRLACPKHLSLVAEDDQKMVGHFKLRSHKSGYDGFGMASSYILKIPVNSCSKGAFEAKHTSQYLGVPQQKTLARASQLPPPFAELPSTKIFGLHETQVQEPTLCTQCP